MGATSDVSFFSLLPRANYKIFTFTTVAVSCIKAEVTVVKLFRGHEPAQNTRSSDVRMLVDLLGRRGAAAPNVAWLISQFTNSSLLN